jgi:hypothetical protein
MTKLCILVFILAFFGLAHSQGVQCPVGCALCDQNGCSKCFDSPLSTSTGQPTCGVEGVTVPSLNCLIFAKGSACDECKPGFAGRNNMAKEIDPD